MIHIAGMMNQFMFTKLKLLMQTVIIHGIHSTLNVTSVLPDWLSFRNDGNGTGVLYGLSSVADEGNHTITLQHLIPIKLLPTNHLFFR